MNGRKGLLADSVETKVGDQGCVTLDHGVLIRIVIVPMMNQYPAKTMMQSHPNVLINNTVTETHTSKIL